MDSLDKRILDLIKKYMSKLFNRKVLKTTEEVEANTNENNLVAAPVVGELINSLSNMFVVSGVTEYIPSIGTNGVCQRAVNCIKAGYTPIGIVGISGTPKYVTPATHYITGTTLICSFANYTSISSSAYDVIFYVLYQKNT